MIDLKLGAILLFLLPGFCAFCGFYGLFEARLSPLGPLRAIFGRTGQGVAFAPAPPEPNSIKTLTIILIASMIVHAVTAVAGSIMLGLASLVVRGIDTYDPYGWIFTSLGTPKARAVAILLSISLVQGWCAYWFTRRYLERSARANALPPWLFGWAADLANELHRGETIVYAIVATNTDVVKERNVGQRLHKTPQTVAYIGAVHDLGVTSNGAISRVHLIGAQRFVLVLDAPFEDAKLEPLASFDHIAIEAIQIRNVTFQTVNACDLLPEIFAAAAPVLDPLVAAIERLYAAPQSQPLQPAAPLPT